MPVEFCPFTPVIMRHKLSKKREVFSDEDAIPESKSPSVFFPGEIIVTGKIRGKLELAEKFTMKSEFVIREQRIFFFVGAVNEDFISVQRFAYTETKKAEKHNQYKKDIFKIH
jgi:hypothetical protein